MKVAILAAGESVSNFTKSLLNIKFDEVWGLNQCATWKGIHMDKLFVMDDLKLRMPFYSGYDFTEYLKTYDKTIVTSKAYPEWPTSVDYPIYDICNYFGVPLGISMYSTPDYMIALAIYMGAAEIHLYGVDLTDKTLHEMRIATACWIGAAHARGVLVKTYHGSMFQYITNPGHCMECGMYGYAKRPRIEDLVNPEYYEAHKKHLEEYTSARG